MQVGFNPSSSGSRLQLLAWGEEYSLRSTDVFIATTKKFLLLCCMQLGFNPSSGGSRLQLPAWGEEYSLRLPP
jgi:hypothetical protein